MTKANTIKTTRVQFWNPSRRKKLNIGLIIFVAIEFAGPGIMKLYSSGKLFSNEAFEIITVVMSPPANDLSAPIIEYNSDSASAEFNPATENDLIQLSELNLGDGQQIPADGTSPITATQDAVTPNIDSAITSAAPESAAAIPAPIKVARVKHAGLPTDDASKPTDAGVLAFPDPPTDAPNSLEEAIGSEAMAASEQIIAENEGYRHPDQISVAREIGISDKQYFEVKRRESILRKQLKRADRAGADAFRKLLMNDHTTWLREYLGHDKAEKYKELTQ
jgi:hypothetical protein